MNRSKNLFIIGLVLLFNGTVFGAIALSSKLASFGALGVCFFTLGAVALFLFNAQRKKIAVIQKSAAKMARSRLSRSKKMR